MAIVQALCGVNGRGRVQDERGATDDSRALRNSLETCGCHTGQMTAAITIQPGNLTDPAVLRLLNDHLADMFATSPAESVHALEASALTAPGVSFWTITDGGEVLGCVAIKEIDTEHCELKSMRTDASARGRGLGALLLEHALGQARQRGYRRISLETGTEDFFEPARRLYIKNGFHEIGPFADYVLDPNSVFMTLELA